MTADVWAMAADLIDPPPNPHRHDPAGWIKARLGEHLWSKQVEVVEAVRDHPKVAVHSCHDAGKSYVAARIAAWWLDTHPPGEAFVVSTAPTFPQVRAILWREIGRAHRKGDLPGRVNQTEWHLADEIVAYGRKPSDYDEAAFQGIHARFVLAILDEACGIPPQLWTAVEAITTNRDSRILAVGNPDDPAAHFAQVCGPKSGWHTIRIDGLRTPNLDRATLAEALDHVGFAGDTEEQRQQRADLLEATPERAEPVPDGLRDPSGLSYVDQKMAAAGPALEVVGRYGRILDKKGQLVDLTRYLPLARQAVTEAHNLSFDTLPLDTFDQKTRFALEWVRSFGRRVQASSEARWQRLAADLEEPDTAGVLQDVPKGVRLTTSKEAKVEPVEGMPLFEVALAAAAAWRDGTLEDAATAIREAGVQPDDPHFWACINALSKNLPETDEDGTVWTSVVRNREGLAAGIANAEAAVRAAAARQEREAKAAQQRPQLFEDPNSLFGEEGNGA